jgi:murein DD-endopeptidase MepM/ murein hydrolase activator NlpD
VDIMFPRKVAGPVEEPFYAKRWFCFSPEQPLVNLACYDGKVSKIKRNSKGALSVVLDHGNVPFVGPLASFYQHNIVELVKVGDIVKAGQPISILGRSGTTLNHLHFELWLTALGPNYRDWPVDPEPYLKHMRHVESGYRKAS